MAWLPGWDSIDGAKSWGDLYFWFGIACLFLLGASEILSHYYGVRKDELVAAAESGLNEERAKKDAQYEDQLRSAQKAADDATMKAAQLAAQSADRQIRRHLRPDQKDFLVSALSTFAGQKVELWCLVGVLDCNAFAEDFRDVFRRAGWAEPTINYGTGDYDVKGIEPFVNESLKSEPLATPPIPAAETLAHTLFTLGLIQKAIVNVHPSMPIDTVLLRIGRKITANQP
jgi:hypothetical protein